MILAIYLGETIYVWINTFKSMKDNDKRLKKEGYTFIKKRFNGIGDIVVGTMFLIALSIPVLNLIFPLSNRDKEKNYDNYKNYLLESNAIIEPNLVKENNIINIDNIKLKERTNRNGHIYYSSMYQEIEKQEENNGYTYKKILK